MQTINKTGCCNYSNLFKKISSVNCLLDVHRFQSERNAKIIKDKFKVNHHSHNYINGFQHNCHIDRTNKSNNTNNSTL